MPSFIPQAGAIVVRPGESTPEVLLILSKKKPQCRIFPKGHIEQGESAVAAAKRELLEEAGVRGEIIKETDTVQFEFRGKWFQVTYFLFHFIKSISEGEKGRDPHWYTADEAYAILPFNELKTLLHRALNSYSSN